MGTFKQTTIDNEESSIGALLEGLQGQEVRGRIEVLIKDMKNDLFREHYHAEPVTTDHVRGYIDELKAIKQILL